MNFENWMANSRGALPPAKSPDLFAAWARNGMPAEYDQHPLWARHVGVGWGKGSPGSSGASDLAPSVSGESHTSSGDLDVTGGGSREDDQMLTARRALVDLTRQVTLAEVEAHNRLKGHQPLHLHLRSR